MASVTRDDVIGGTGMKYVTPEHNPPNQHDSLPTWYKKTGEPSLILDACTGLGLTAVTAHKLGHRLGGLS